MQIASILGAPLQDVAAASDGARLAVIDMVGLGIVGLLVVLGLWRGLWWQVIRLAGIVAAVILARASSPALAGWIAEKWPELSPRLAHGVAWFAIFLGAMGLATLLGILGNRLLEAMQLGLANRVAGGVIGAATGLLVHLSILVALCQLAPETFVGDSIAGTYSERLVDTVGNRWRVVLGAEASEEVDRIFQQAQPKRGSVR